MRHENQYSNLVFTLFHSLIGILISNRWLWLTWFSPLSTPLSLFTFLENSNRWFFGRISSHCPVYFPSLRLLTLWIGFFTWLAFKGIMNCRIIYMYYSLNEQCSDSIWFYQIGNQSLSLYMRVYMFFAHWMKSLVPIHTAENFFLHNLPFLNKKTNDPELQAE